MSDSRIVRLALALFLCRVIIGAFLIPAWQGPDEPSHYVLAELVGASKPSDAVMRADLERNVVRSMGAHQWWRGYRQATPSPPPTSFADVPEHLAYGTTLQPVYYVLAGTILRFISSTDIDVRYFVLRMLSVLLGVATIVMGWAGARILFDPRTASIVALAASLSPQFLVGALAVSPEALVNAFGAFLWWQMARFVVSGSLASVVLTGLAAVSAAWTKRNAVPLLAAPLLLGGIAAWRKFSIDNKLLSAVGMAIGYAIAWIAVVVAFTQVPSFAPIRVFWSYTVVIREPLNALTLRRVVDFTTGLIDSSWLVAGWLRFPAPLPWLRIVRLLTFGAGLGIPLALIRRPHVRVPILVAFVPALTQILATLVTGVILGGAPQGRYLFVVAAPLVALIWIGFAEWWPEDWRWLAAPTLVAMLLALDITGWITTLLPAYV